MGIHACGIAVEESASAAEVGGRTALQGREKMSTNSPSLRRRPRRRKRFFAENEKM
jgi:hypothetical protein